MKPKVISSLDCQHMITLEFYQIENYEHRFDFTYNLNILEAFYKRALSTQLLSPLTDALPLRLVELLCPLGHMVLCSFYTLIIIVTRSYCALFSHQSPPLDRDG